MALGGGIWLVQNKILPGSYINFISIARSGLVFSERGFATIPIIGDWGELGKVIECTTGDLQTDSMRLFGYDYTAPELRPLRELFKRAKVGYLYRLGTGGTAASSTDYGSAKYVGKRGNHIKIIVQENVDDAGLFDVTVMLGETVVETHTVSAMADLVDSDYVKWDKNASLALTAGTPMTGGVNPTVTNADHQSYLDLIEGYNFNAIGCPSDDPTVKMLYSAFTKRMRDEQGVKFQCVNFSPDFNNDFEGVVDVLNKVLGDDTAGYELIYWVTGCLAGKEVNKSALNDVYDGEYTIQTNDRKSYLENAIKGGKFAFHTDDGKYRVLADINSLVNVTLEKGDPFKENQTIRVIDQIANDIAVLFNTQYLGVVPNDQAGRISLWSDIVRHHFALQDIRAIENFVDSNVTVEQGDTKQSVLVTDLVEVVNVMGKLYMTVYVA